jgi:lysozyme
MKTSDNGVQFIKNEEGCILHVYKDQVGLDTIGVGHLVQPGENWPATITMQQAEDLLKSDLAKYEANVNKQVKVELSQWEFDALVSLAFNIGNGNFNKSSVLRYLNMGDKATAAGWFKVWNKAKKNGKLITLPVLTNRRAREIRVFLEGIYK